MASLLSPADLADLNRARVLRALCDHGPQSRADLARLTGVARATTGKIAQTLLDAHLLEEGAPVLGGGVGKPARPLWFAPGAGPSVAIDLRGGGAEIAAIDARGEILASERTALAPAVTGAEAADVLLAAAKRVALGLKPLGVGVALPGVTDPTTGAVIGSGQLPGIVGTDLAEALAEVGPVVIDNDARAQALAEKWFGLGRGVPTFASVQTGEGLGAGVVIDGVLLRGGAGQPTEIGHTCVVAHDGARCRCGLRGCWETIATLPWLRAEAAHLGVSDAAGVSALRLVELSAAGDAVAGGLLDIYVDNLAVGVANLAQLLGPTLVILHGDVALGGPPMLELLRTRVAARSFRHPGTRLRIEASVLGERATLLGAAALVLAATFRHQ